MDSLECIANEVRKLHDKFDNHIIEEMALRSEALKTQQDNTTAINNLSDATAGLVEVYSTISSLSKFIKWSATLLAAVFAAFKYYE